MRVIFLDTANHIAQWVAHYIIYKINVFNPTVNNLFVLGLPAGSTPIGVYNCLIHMYKSGKISFKYVVVFTIDEYLGLSYKNPCSYYTFIHQNFINHIDILKENVHCLNGNPSDVYMECQQYEEKIKLYGKINLLIGGVGSNGHIAFNEPGSSLYSRTRVHSLSRETRLSNSKFFSGEINSVPKFALTIGVATLLESQEIIIIAVGQDKSIAVQAAVEGNINHMWTISYLQLHDNAILICDELSSMELKMKTIKYFQELEVNN